MNFPTVDPMVGEMTISLNTTCRLMWPMWKSTYPEGIMWQWRPDVGAIDAIQPIKEGTRKQQIGTFDKKCLINIKQTVPTSPTCI